MAAGYTRFYCTLFLIIYFLNCSSVGKRSGHVPYRDSKLTRILQLSLGGNARTAIICTMSPALSHVEQSRNTLFFATCAKEVTNSAQVNMVCRESWSILVLGSSFYRFNFFGEQFLCSLRFFIWSGYIRQTISQAPAKGSCSTWSRTAYSRTIGLVVFRGPSKGERVENQKGIAKKNG